MESVSLALAYITEKWAMPLEGWKAELTGFTAHCQLAFSPTHQLQYFLLLPALQEPHVDHTLSVAFFTL